MGLRIQIDKSHSQDIQLIVEVNSRGKTILAGAGVALGAIALIGLLASFGLHHTALTVAQDCAKCALTGSVVSFCLAGIIFAAEKRTKKKCENVLQNYEISIELFNNFNCAKEEYDGVKYNKYESLYQIEVSGKKYRLILLEGNKETYFDINRQPLKKVDKKYILKLIM